MTETAQTRTEYTLIFPTGETLLTTDDDIYTVPTVEEIRRIKETRDAGGDLTRIASRQVTVGPWTLGEHPT